MTRATAVRPQTAEENLVLGMQKARAECAALAPLIVQRLVDVVREIRRRGVAMLLVEQKMTIALDVSDRVDVMGHGRIVFSGSPDALKNDTEVQRRWLEVSGSGSDN
jgi:ABC-type branched-subunit amino acid transport system ATPase component